MANSTLLWIDAIINLVLGVLLLVFPAALVELLGIPPADSRFYPSLLGAVLFGIGLALVQEARNRSDRGSAGLGLRGALTINLCAGGVLAGWLLVGNLDLPTRGVVFLWLLVVLLVGISGMEAMASSRGKPSGTRSG